MPQPPPPLPTPRAFLSSLLNNLPPPPPKAATTTSNPLPLPSTSKSPLLTLHALFPTLLLPALDLLDRRLLTRFVLKEQTIAEEAVASTASSTTNPNPNPDNDNEHGFPPAPAGSKKSSSSRRIIYYALSSTSSHSTTSHRPSFRRQHDPTTHYEIRPQAWSCTCPAFAFSAYNNTVLPESAVTYEGGGWGDEEDDEDAEMLDIPEPEEVLREDHGHGHEHDWWGGLMRVEEGEEVPLCKHLLACLLAERWEVVKGSVEERVVGREEMAGWAAGWGG